MHAIKVLHKKITKTCPSIHKKRLNILMLATQALLTGQRLSLTQLGRQLASAAQVKHKIKRIDRLLGNAHLHHERTSIYQFLCTELIKGQTQPLIIVDWSELTTEGDYHLLRASVPVGGRALTLYEETHPQTAVGQKKTHQRFLEQLRHLLPEGCCPIIITDAGFRNPWFKAVRALKWHYVGRIRNTDLLKPVRRQGWKPCKTLYSQATSQPCYLGEYTVVRSNPIDTHLYLVKQKPKGRHCYNEDGTRTRRGKSEKMAKRQKDPWLMTTSLSGGKSKTQYIIGLYKTRMQIEEAFRDTKNARIGFSISESQTRNQQRLNSLLLIGALATFMAWLIGLWAEHKQWHRQYQSSSNKKRRVLSTFFIGCQIAKENKIRLKPRQYKLALLHLKTSAMELCCA